MSNQVQTYTRKQREKGIAIIYNITIGLPPDEYVRSTVSDIDELIDNLFRYVEEKDDETK